MKYKAKIDLWINVMFYLTVALTVVPMFTIPGDELLMYVLITSPINIFILWMLFGSYIL